MGVKNSSMQDKTHGSNNQKMDGRVQRTVHCSQSVYSSSPNITLGVSRACGAERSGPAAMMMDGSMDTDESKTSSEGREGWGEGKMRRGKGTKASHGQQCLQFVLLIAHGEG
jgi:hypothetical protein